MQPRRRIVLSRRLHCVSDFFHAAGAKFRFVDKCQVDRYAMLSPSILDSLGLPLPCIDRQGVPEFRTSERLVCLRLLSAVRHTLSGEHEIRSSLAVRV